jgi:alpha-N-acetylglucosaminidase
MYSDLIDLYNSSQSTQPKFAQQGKKIIQLLTDLDSLLLTNKNFRLSTWIDAARAWAHGNTSQASMLEYNARNQITLWGPNGEITDYASKQWGGLVSSYYVPRWRLFVEYLKSTPTASYNETELRANLRNFELQWQDETWSAPEPTGDDIDLEKVLKRVSQHWSSIFGLR